MNKPRHPLVDLLIESIRDPKGFAPRLVGMALAPQTIWLAITLMATLSSILVVGIPVMFGAEPVIPGSDFAISPVAFAGVQIAAMLVAAFAITRIGGVFGGTGKFDGALRIVVWMQFVMVVLSVAQFLTLLVLAPLLWIVNLASFGIICWVTTGLIAGLHGFRSLPTVFLGIIGSFFAIGFVLNLILAVLLGIRG